MTQFLQRVSCVSLWGSPLPHTECINVSQGDDVRSLCQRQGDGLARSAVQGLGSDCHVGLLSGSLSGPLIFKSRLCAFLGAEFSCPVLFSLALKIPSQKSALGKDMLRELCPPEVTIWPIFILLPKMPGISVGADAGPDHRPQVTTVINQV